MTDPTFLPSDLFTIPRPAPATLVVNGNLTYLPRNFLEFYIDTPVGGTLAMRCGDDASIVIEVFRVY